MLAIIIPLIILVFKKRGFNFFFLLLKLDRKYTCIWIHHMTRTEETSKQLPALPMLQFYDY
jgi:hypothetical protein